MVLLVTFLPKQLPTHIHWAFLFSQIAVVNRIMELSFTKTGPNLDFLESDTETSEQQKVPWRMMVGRWSFPFLRVNKIYFHGFSAGRIAQMWYCWWFRNPKANHLRCITPCKKWNNLPTSTGEFTGFLSINGSSGLISSRSWLNITKA